MARRRTGKKRLAHQRGMALGQQKARTERGYTISSRNEQISDMKRKQRDAEIAAAKEGGWMKWLGAIVAIAAVTLVTGGFGAGALGGLGGLVTTNTTTLMAGLIKGAAAGVGTLAGMGAGDVIGGDVESKFAEAGKTDVAAYHGTLGTNYEGIFKPVEQMSDRAATMGEAYETQKGQAYTWAPLTAAATSLGSTWASGAGKGPIWKSKYGGSRIADVGAGAGAFIDYNKV